MTELNGIIELTLGGPYKSGILTVSPICIDARAGHETKISDRLPEGGIADASFSIRPELIVQLFEGSIGIMDARFADVKTYPASYPQGNALKAARFLQLLAREVPYQLDPNKKWDVAELKQNTKINCMDTRVLST